MDTMLLESARLQRSVQPYAIVDPAPKNAFASASTYRTVNAAIAAGHLWIKLAAGTHAPFTASLAYCLIEGPSQAIVDGGITAHAINVTAAYVTIRGISAKTTAGGGSAYYAVLWDGQYGLCEGVHILASDNTGFTSKVSGANAAAYTRFINCTANATDGWAFQLTSNLQQVIGCMSYATCGAAGVYMTDTYADGCLVSGCTFGGALGQIDAGCNYNGYIGNAADSGITDSGTGNDTTDNIIF